MIYNKVKLEENEINFIENFLFTDSFPWFYQKCQTDFDPPTKIKKNVGSSTFFSHALMLRNKDVPGESGIINSEYYNIFYRIFLRWLTENNVSSPKKIFRAGLNLTFYNDNKHSVPHYDHEWPHWNWIMYLNTTSAPTLLFDQDYKIIADFACKQYYACTFEKTLHAHKFPAIEESRCVCVFTYI